MENAALAIFFSHPVKLCCHNLTHTHTHTTALTSEQLFNCFAQVEGRSLTHSLTSFIEVCLQPMSSSGRIFLNPAPNLQLFSPPVGPGGDRRWKQPSTGRWRRKTSDEQRGGRGLHQVSGFTCGSIRGTRLKLWIRLRHRSNKSFMAGDELHVEQQERREEL